MAVDYGDKRTGVAVSDESATLAGEAWVIHSSSEHETAHMIVSEALARGVSQIVVGYPRNMDGTVSVRAEKSERLADLMRTLCDIEVVLWDERMTTVSAHRILTETGKFGKKRKKNIDAVAASLILGDYLAFLNNRHI
jgi:putative Holliday junction resolvase